MRLYKVSGTGAKPRFAGSMDGARIVRREVVEESGVKKANVAIDEVTDRYAVKDPDLLRRLKAHAAEEDRIRTAEKEMERAVAGLLAGCSTLESFFAVMPEAKAMVKSATLDDPAPRALVVSSKQILCMVAAARDEKREGCVDGKLVSAA